MVVLRVLFGLLTLSALVLAGRDVRLRVAFWRVLYSVAVACPTFSLTVGLFSPVGVVFEFIGVALMGVAVVMMLLDQRENQVV